MDSSRFDYLVRSFGTLRSRRAATAFFSTLATSTVFAILETDAKKKKKKKRKKKKSKPVCTPRCSGCGGSDGCGGTCGCAGNQICDGGTCHTCDVTCSEDPVGCGARLSQRVQSGGTIYICPGRYQTNLTVPTGKLIGAGSGENPTTSTILDGSSGGRVITVAANASVELVGLRITKGNEINGAGGGIAALDAELRVTRCVVHDNFAENGGGGLWVRGPFQINRSTISANRTDFQGGGLRIDSYPSHNCFITDSSIIGNTSAAHGGGLVKSNAPLSVTNSEISGNTAGNQGGAILTNGGSLIFNSTCRINNNTAPSAGLAYAVNDATVVLNGATHTGNSAPECVGVTC